jgi:hypothetical protein
MVRVARLIFPLALAFAAIATASPAASSATVPLAVKLTGCTTGASAADRAATFSASMPALKGTKRMWIRFQLAQRRGTKGAFVVVPVPGWGEWEKSGANRSGFVFLKRVESLLAPASYRAQVTLRWLDRHGKVQRQVTRNTDACTEPDLRADLHLVSFEAARAKDASQAVYELVVENRGASDAAGFSIGLADGAASLGTASLAGLPAGSHQTIKITGPACSSGDTVAITVDAGHAVDERAEADDASSRPCPLR